MTEHPRSGSISVDVAARLLRVSRRRFFQLVSDGWISKDPAGEYTIVGVVHGALDYRDDQLKRAQKNEADNRLRDARAREIELRTARQEGELVPIDEANAIMHQIVGRMVSLLASVPARVTRDVRLRRQIEDAIDEVRSQLSKELVKLGEEYGRGPPPDVEEAT